MAGRSFLCITLVAISAMCCNSQFVQDPTQIVAKALACFNDKYVYSSCNEEYRLRQNGYLNVPHGATDQFCYGPCLAETHLLLDCISHTLPSFNFFNRATIEDMRSMLAAACSHGNQRGNFNVEEYRLDDWSSAYPLPNQNKFLVFIFPLLVLVLTAGAL